MKHLLDYDPLTGMQTFFEHDSSTGKNTIETVQDCEPFIERSKHLAEGLDKKEDWWYIGTIPNVKVMEWATETGTRPYSKEWSEIVFKKLNLPEFRKLNPNRIKL